MKTLTKTNITECWAIATRRKYYDRRSGEYRHYYLAQFDHKNRSVAAPTLVNARLYPVEPSIPEPLSPEVWTTRRLLISEI